MAVESQQIFPSGDEPEDLALLQQRGLAFYESKLRALLEPAHNGEVVAIHVDSEDYTVAQRSGDAMRAIRKRHPEGKLLLHTVGPVTTYGLASRMLGARLLSRR